MKPKSDQAFRSNCCYMGKEEKKEMKRKEELALNGYI